VVKFGYTINYVRDVDIALSFFEKAFEMTRRFITDENDYGELNTGETVLAFASHELGLSNFSGGYISSTDSEKPLGIEIALITDDVSGIHQRAIQYGAVELKSPETKPWGQVVSYVRCPSGILIELCTPIQS
jgi:catechol 2,3-dioxygenase-like lactoylglutathione lyase family enzyme|tara:strand:- start:908 stop:1303 length:396 start_codon:yes stop_codon:yes gene_type:complete